VDRDGGASYVSLRRAGGEAVIRSSDLYGTDASGGRLESRIELRDCVVALVIADSGASYPLHGDTLVGTEMKRLAASDAQDSDGLRYSIAICGNTAVGGAYLEDGAGTNCGAAHILNGKWENGDACSDPSQCWSGYSVDGVCCKTACGEGSTTDCIACSVAIGASTSGLCAALTGSTRNDGLYCNGVDTCTAGARA
jgi:hypothetical protein